MYKAGDKFVIVESEYLGDYWRAGNIVEFIKQCDNVDGVYEFKKPGSSDGYFLNFGIDGETRFHSTVRPLRTEAEKRGAKFGVGGVIKSEGIRVVFTGIREDKCYVTGNEVWRIVREDKPFYVVAECHSEIRLDHEPEYKEIPFSEATHEQKMDANNLQYHGERVVNEIFRFNNGSYGYTVEWDEGILQDTDPLTIRIPT